MIMSRVEFIPTPSCSRLYVALFLLAPTLGCSGSDNGGTGPSSGGDGTTAGTTGVAGGNSAGGTTASGGNPSGGTNSTGGANAVGGISGTGGSPARGGSVATGGGSTNTGGAKATGGAATTGGANVAGGSANTGGSKTTGGANATGGAQTSGGSKSTGGVANTGGTKATGGLSTTGGNNATGGIAATGGTKATGGTTATGGSKSTGGATATGGSKAAGGTGQKCSVYIAGDSTVSTYTLTSSTKDQAGWGQMLQQYYDGATVTVVNRAVGGMTARHFIQAGNLDAILTLLKAGDYFLVQFGTNDSNTTATYTISGVSYPYFADANTDFKTYLQQYIDGARARSATPVLVTPPPRNSAYCGGGRSMAGYAQAMLDLGKADGVAVVDLSMKTWSYLNVICPRPADGTTENFFKVNTDNTIDGTHFQENGATIMAGFVADGIGEAGLGLNAYRIK
jgi:lysophospholipase L1-like esterase